MSLFDRISIYCGLLSLSSSVGQFACLHVCLPACLCVSVSACVSACVSV